MEALCDLLFEMSNEDRLKILLELEKGPKNLYQIAKELDTSLTGDLEERGASRGDLTHPQES